MAFSSPYQGILILPPHPIINATLIPIPTHSKQNPHLPEFKEGTTTTTYPPLSTPSQLPYCPSLKFPTLQSIYTNGSVFETLVNTSASYGIHSSFFEEHIVVYLPCYQNILQVEIMAIHKAPTFLHSERHTSIFTNSLVFFFSSK